MKLKALVFSGIILACQLLTTSCDEDSINCSVKIVAAQAQHYHNLSPNIVEDAENLIREENQHPKTFSLTSYVEVKNTTVILAYSNNTPIGVLLLSKDKIPGLKKVYGLSNLVVKPLYRKQGVGTLLVAKAAELVPSGTTIYTHASSPYTKLILEKYTTSCSDKTFNLIRKEVGSDLICFTT